jgi:PKD repeat protein
LGGLSGTPTVQYPTESFTAGTWSVRMTVTNSNSSNTKTRTDYLVVSAGPYVAPAVHFDGATQLYTRTFSGISSSVGTFFHWFKCASTPSVLSTIANFVDTGTQPASPLPKTDGTNQANFYVGSGGQPYYQYQVNDALQISDAGISAHVDVETDTWTLIAISWDVNAIAGSRTYQILLGNVLQTVVKDWEDGIAFAIDWSVGDFIVGVMDGNSMVLIGLCQNHF